MKLRLFTQTAEGGVIVFTFFQTFYLLAKLVIIDLK